MGRTVDRIKRLAEIAFALDQVPFQLDLTYRLQPDDPSHAHAVIRAWDRHLRVMGLHPIGTDDLSKVGPILQDPGEEYIVYEFDERGWLTSRRETVLQPAVQKASSSARGRVSVQVQEA